jgi:hypothetical protein
MADRCAHKTRDLKKETKFKIKSKNQIHFFKFQQNEIHNLQEKELKSQIYSPANGFLQNSPKQN